MLGDSGKGSGNGSRVEESGRLDTSEEVGFNGSDSCV